MEKSKKSEKPKPKPKPVEAKKVSHEDARKTVESKISLSTNFTEEQRNSYTTEITNLYVNSETARGIIDSARGIFITSETLLRDNFRGGVPTSINGTPDAPGVVYLPLDSNQLTEKAARQASLKEVPLSEQSYKHGELPGDLGIQAILGHKFGHTIKGELDPKNVHTVDNPIRSELGLPPRETYDGKSIYNNDSERATAQKRHSVEKGRYNAMKNFPPSPPTSKDFNDLRQNSPFGRSLH